MLKLFGVKFLVVFVVMFAVTCVVTTSSSNQSNSGESGLWVLIRKYMAGPLYAVHLKLESLKNVPDVGKQMRSIYQSMFNIKNKTELTFVQNSDFVISAMLLSFICFILLILLNFSNYIVTILVTLLLIIVYRLQGQVWCFDNIVLLFSLLSLAPAYILQHPSSIMPFISTSIAIYFTYRILSRLFGKTRPQQSTNPEQLHASNVDQASTTASIEHRLAIFEAQQQTILAKLDAVINQIQANGPR